MRAFWASSDPGDSVGQYSSYAFSWVDEVIREGDGWRLPLNLETNYESMRSLYFIDHHLDEDFKGFRNPACDGLGLFDMKLTITVGSDDWDPPGGVFEPNALAHAGTLANVENGFGFVAGGYNEDRPLHPVDRHARQHVVFRLHGRPRARDTGLRQSGRVGIPSAAVPTSPRAYRRNV